MWCAIAYCVGKILTAYITVIYLDYYKQRIKSVLKIICILFGDVMQWV